MTLRSRLANSIPRPYAAAVAATALLAWHGALRAADAPGQDGPSFTFSGIQRTRYETLDPQFRKGFDDSDQVLALRTSVMFDAKFDALQFYAEIMDSRAMLNDENSYLTGVVNALEPIQAYVAWTRKDLFEDGATSTVRAGRMTLDIGSRRILARDPYKNTVTSFLGADWLWQDAAGRNARLFYFLPMQTVPDALEAQLDNDIELDHATRGSRVIGAYYQLPPFAGKSIVETYLLDNDVDAPPSNLASAAHWLVAGARAYRTPKPGSWGYEVETVWEQGRTGGTVHGVAYSNLAMRAYFAHAEVGYGFARPWRPTLLLQYDVASGDHDPNDTSIERFNTLFGIRRGDFGPTGIFGPFWRANIDSPGVRLTFVPQPRWQAMFSYRRFQLDQARDQWVGSGWSDPTGRSGRALGTQLESTFIWTAIEHRLSIETGFALVASGSYPHQVEGAAFRGDPHYFYLTATTTF